MKKNQPEASAPSLSALPFQIKIANPCPARWADMGGDDRVRFCDHCRKNVYNLSAMSIREAADLLQSHGSDLCARIFQRADGTVLTEDCPVGVAGYWRHLKALVAGGVAVVLVGCASAFAIAGKKGDDDESGSRVAAVARNATDKIKNWMGIKTSPMLGKICVVPRSTSPATAQTPPTPPAATPAK